MELASSSLSTSQHLVVPLTNGLCKLEQGGNAMKGPIVLQMFLMFILKQWLTISMQIFPMQCSYMQMHSLFSSSSLITFNNMVPLLDGCPVKCIHGTHIHTHSAKRNLFQTKKEIKHSMKTLFSTCKKL